MSRLHAAYIRDETLIAADAAQWAATSLHVASPPQTPSISTAIPLASP